MRLLDVVLGERSMDGQRVRKAVPEQLPRSLAGDHRDTDEDLGMVLALLLSRISISAKPQRVRLRSSRSYSKSSIPTRQKGSWLRSLD